MIEEGWRQDAGVVVHDADGRHVVMDYPTDGETPDSYRTAWAPHVFAESFRQNPHPPYLLNHDENKILGSAVRCESLPDRARVVNRFADTPRAEEVRTLILGGHLPGCSFHFRRGIAERLPNSVRRYKSADFLESSSVTFPAIPGAVVAGVRSRDPRESGVALDELAAAFRRLSERERRRRLGSEVAESVAQALAEGHRAAREDQWAMPDPGIALQDLQRVFARHGIRWSR